MNIFIEYQNLLLRDGYESYEDEEEEVVEVVEDEEEEDEVEEVVDGEVNAEVIPIDLEVSNE